MKTHASEKGNAGHHRRDGLAGTCARMFVKSPLTLLIVVTSILLGVLAVVQIPREEEPQIKVPMIDVFVAMPGASAKEVSERVTRPMEKLLWEIPGVEYLYSTSQSGQSMTVVRFQVGSDVDSSILKLNHKLEANFDRIPHGVSYPLIKPRSIDDVPILAVSLHSQTVGHLELRRLAAQLDDEIKKVENVAETKLIGGLRKQFKVVLDPDLLASRNLSLLEVVPRITQANKEFVAGSISSGNKELLIQSGAFIFNVADLENVVVGVFGTRPVYLKDVASIADAPEDFENYVMFGYGQGARHGDNRERVTPVSAGFSPAVTLSVAKRPGANAITVVEAVAKKIELVRPYFIPSDVEISIVRNYGETAKEKSNELLFHMLLAVVGVAALILFVLGWKEAIVVAIAIPATLALTLLVFYLFGYTLNRITLFALIFAIGILVDDAIVVVENIVRLLKHPRNRGASVVDVAIEAVSEVGNPTILATLAVIAAILPLAFVGGLMGPYMRPIPVGATAAMVFSLLIAFAVTPWATVILFGMGRTGRGERRHLDRPEDWFTQLYRSFMGALIRSTFWRYTFLLSITMLLLGACSFVWFGMVKVKMLPFDNKSEFQVIVNLPEGTPLEQTARVVKELADVLGQQPEVRDYQAYIGTSSPFNFNGLVRHYFIRNLPHQADIQVNLVGKEERVLQSHDIAKRVRPQLAAVAGRFHARLQVAEVPPGPPVLQTLVAEVYGDNVHHRERLAAKVRDILSAQPGVVDVDWYVEAPQEKYLFRIDKEKAALHGVSSQHISDLLKFAVSGAAIDLMHSETEKEDAVIQIEVPRQLQVSPEQLLSLQLRSQMAPNALGQFSTPLVPLRELVTIEQTSLDRSIYHKNLMPVTYVTADVAGEIESPVYAIFELNRKLEKLDRAKFGGSPGKIEIFNASQPFTGLEPAIKWDGEWHITLEVFRDLGLAFAIVCLLIYILMVGWFSSFLTPLVVMTAIPFSLVGILPAHFGMDAFFTATSMIGFMAGAGIVVRNSIILVDFIEERLREGVPLQEAVVEAGAIRFRPMMLTAMAVVVGAGVILFDPIFQGLAISLIAGEIASLFISRMAVPVVYYMSKDR